MDDKTNAIDPTRRTPSDLAPTSIARKLAVERLVKTGGFNPPPSDDGPHEREMTALLHSFDGTPRERFVWEIYFDWSRPKICDRGRINEAAANEGLTFREYVCRETLKEVRRQLKLNGIALPDDSATHGQPPVDAMLSPNDLSRINAVEPENLRKRLARWRKKHAASGGTDWLENTEAGSREPQFLYRVGSVQPIIDDLKNVQHPSGM